MNFEAISPGLGCDNDVTATVTVGRVPVVPGRRAECLSTVRVLGSHGHLLIDDESPALRHFGEERATRALHGSPVAHTIEWTFDELCGHGKAVPGPSTVSPTQLRRSR